MTSKRRTRSERQGQKFNVGGAWTEEKNTDIEMQEQFTVGSTTSLSSRTLGNSSMRETLKTALPRQPLEQKSVSKSAIDQIRSEIFEEKYISSVEPEYWDDSHNWDLDNDTESEEYWHFVGRYE